MNHIREKGENGYVTIYIARLRTRSRVWFSANHILLTSESGALRSIMSLIVKGESRYRKIVEIETFLFPKLQEVYSLQGF